METLDRDQKAEKIKSYIDSNLHNNISLLELSIEFELSRFQVFRIFQKLFHKTPHQYMVEARIERAIALLDEGEPLAGIAPAVGFVDQSHMTRHFKKFCGTTPYCLQTERRNRREAGLWSAAAAPLAAS